MNWFGNIFILISLLMKLLTFCLLFVLCSGHFDCTLWKNPESVIFFIHICPENSFLSPPSLASSCAVESAIKFNPAYDVWVISNCWDSSVPVLNDVKYYNIDLETYFSDSNILGSWYKSNIWNRGYKYHHLTDGLRLLVLYSCGGLYLVSSTIEMFILVNIRVGF